MQEKWLPGNTMDRIRDLCRSRNITQVELAQAVGMDKSTLSRVMAEKQANCPAKTLSPSRITLKFRRIFCWD